MKTREELIAAMDMICAEASKSGFSFCAALNHDCKITTVIAGNPMILLGLSDLLKREVLNDLRMVNKRKIPVK
jgi:hypothetical protein